MLDDLNRMIRSQHIVLLILVALAVTIFVGVSP